MTAGAVWSAPVRYGECDQQGVVFNAHYLLYCDEAMSALCIARGLQSLAVDVRLVTSTLTWAGPARYGDVVEVDAGCSRLGISSLVLDFEIRASGRPCCTVRTTYVYTDPHTGSSRPIPDELRTRIR